ncbi:uncharacterized protein LTR77_009462 [Saxophila tyrrhenica]|uniref:Mediator of RNA polymerase II transcription subunit 1 n=1 Tax=Saxophila tyrrhenica TaxID=1690608 RepID=A0AAV9NYM5_9PEZI|nr:hypothetical protein LTR77_009462 [Saxophila tyrrhenica]
MATPTPSSASKRAAGGVSTPSHLAQHSPPRSVPSPANARHPAGKTPVNHPTTGSSQGSKTLGSTPMVQNLSQSGNTSSPSANMLSFGTPSGLNLDGITPSALNIPTPALGGAAMMPSMSELGLTAGGTKRNEDEERRVRMRRVLKAIGKPKGRVSEEGIARVFRRVGFANDIDHDPEQKPWKVGNRMIATAGNTIIIEVDLKNHVPGRVSAMYNVQSKALEEQGEKASKVLLGDLRAPGDVGLQAKLDRFADNLERLAKLDRLSSGRINCFEAISGVYVSLLRLFEQEKKAAMAMLRTKGMEDEEKAAEEVACRRSGKPTVHEHGQLGVAIEYWHGSNMATSDNAATRNDLHAPDDESANSEAEDQIFSLSIQSEAASANLYPSLRVSDTWLPGPLELPEGEESVNVPWQDPPPTFVASDSSEMQVDGQQKLPDLRFIAKLEPALVMPYQTATNILAAVGVSQAPIMSMPSQYAALLLGLRSEAGGTQQPLTSSTIAEREVISQQQDDETTVRHSYTMNSVKPDWGFRLQELPFSHPRQLIELLPTLRQWAVMSQLLKGSFKTAAALFTQQAPSNHVNGTDDPGASLDDLLDAPAESADIPITIALTTSPNPTLDLTFPPSGTDSTDNVSVSVQILPNAHVAVPTQKGLFPDDHDDTPAKVQKLARALEICGDLGVWIEWVRTSIAPRA